MTQAQATMFSLAAMGFLVVVMIYGLCWMVGGQATADRFARWANRMSQEAIVGLGRAFARLVSAFPFAAGIILIILLIMFLGK